MPVSKYCLYWLKNETLKSKLSTDLVIVEKPPDQDKY
jgi:hypothetical protein